MIRRITFFLLVILGALHSGCMNHALEEADKSAQSNVPKRELEPWQSPPRLYESIPDIRAKAKKTAPDSIHEGWEIFHIGKYYYGREKKGPKEEFLTSEIETPPGKIVLIGHSTFTLKNSWIVAAPDSQTTLTGGTFVIAGRSTTEMPTR